MLLATFPALLYSYLRSVLIPGQLSVFREARGRYTAEEVGERCYSYAQRGRGRERNE